jgi:DNA repair exonuclease SbcCD ATPase subunit
MPETDNFLNRIGRIFKRAPRGNGFEAPSGNAPAVKVETNPLIRAPWKRNTAAIAQLQEGFHSLTDLMDEIRQSMVDQGRRQDELIGYLSALPKLLETIPENNRIQGETLKAVHEQLQRHADQEQTLGEILEKLTESGGDQKDLLEGLRERVETLSHQDKAIADNMQSVSVALEQTSRHSAVGTQVLESLRENIVSRDEDMHHVIQKQNLRVTTLLVVAICVSGAALAAVFVMGYMMTHGGMK